MSEVSLQEHVVSYEMLFKYRKEICRDRGAFGLENVRVLRDANGLSAIRTHGHFWEESNR